MKPAALVRDGEPPLHYSRKPRDLLIELIGGAPAAQLRDQFA
jgi:hypothetical protein